jgi:hypothetical protein
VRLHGFPCTASANASLNSLEKPDFIVAKDKRPGVDDYGNEYKYSPGDKVYLCTSGQQEGPYKIEAAENGKYTLCDDYGITVKSGRAYGEDELKLYDPFA